MVRSVSDDGILIGDTHHRQNIAITVESVHDDWPDKAIAELTVDDFAALLSIEPEIILLGTGSSNIFAPRELIFGFARRSIGLEVMDTPAAARTFNVLAGEGRNVAAVFYV